MRAAPVVLALAAPALAQTCIGLGVPPGGYSLAGGISGDGLTVVGMQGTSPARTAYRWTAQTGRVSLPSLAGYAESWALGASANGAVVIGSAEPDARAVRWVGPAAPDPLGMLAGDTFSRALAVARNGLVVAGVSASADWTSVRAFRWENGSMTSLGAIPGSPTFAHIWVSACSADGSVIVGEAEDAIAYERKAFRWTAATGMVDLGHLNSSADNFATAASADGSVVVGGSDETAFRWTAAGGMVELPLLPGAWWGNAQAISADGSVAAGFCQGDFGNGFELKILYWDAGGVHDLAVALGSAVPSGWVFSYVVGLSDDGRTILGEADHDGLTEAFIATPASGAQCYANCDNSTTEPALNIQDFSCFLNRFASGDSYSNCDSSTTAPVLNIQDFSCFLNKFAGGCS